jgi:hypothetical protein
MHRKPLQNCPRQPLKLSITSCAHNYNNHYAGSYINTTHKEPSAPLSWLNKHKVGVEVQALTFPNSCDDDNKLFLNSERPTMPYARKKQKQEPRILRIESGVIQNLSLWSSACNALWLFLRDFYDYYNSIPATWRFL